MNIILLSVIAGIIGTGLGGFVTAMFGSQTDKKISIFLSFAGGVMTSIVFFELIPEAQKHSNALVIIVGLFIGVVMVLFLNSTIDKVSNAGHKTSMPHDTYEAYYHEEKMLAGKRAKIRSGMLMFFVIGLHTIPEGMVIGASGNYDMALGFTLTLMLGIHNIPEGMAIAAPLISGGIKKWKSILLTLLAGAPTVLGAAIGVLIGISNMAIALLFSIAGGAMLYAVFGEILPQSMTMRKDRFPAIVMLVGIVFGFLLSGLW